MPLFAATTAKIWHGRHTIIRFFKSIKTSEFTLRSAHPAGEFELIISYSPDLFYTYKEKINLFIKK